MFRILFITSLFLPAIAAQGATPSAWGFFAHRQLNRHAVYLLPAGMKVFYRPHIHQLSEDAVNPDRRRHIVPDEAARHYIDLDRYEFPDSLPRQWREVVAVFTRDSLMKHGVVPWHILRQLRALTNAFRLRDGTAILRLSADLGHYIGDAHVPLHTTSNYDGQHTQQEGIHGLWESRIPELHFNEFDLFTGAAGYIADPAGAIWTAVLQTHELVDSVLSIEKSLQAEMGEHRMRGFEYRGNRLQYVYSQDYASAYHRRMGDMVASQFRRALLMTASLWYTCWVNAGQPDLSDCSYRYGYPEAWRLKYDSLYRTDSLIFRQDIHLKTGSVAPAAKSFSNMYFCTMNYLSAENLRVSYGDNVLFSKVSLGISQGQKIALVGINGSGKSTLLRVLAGIEKPETGEVAYANGLSIAYLPQLPELDPSADVLDAVMMSDDPVISLVREYERCLSRAHEPSQERRLTDLVSKMDSANAWNYESQVKEILGKLGIHDLYQKIGNMSGGQRKRVGIARALLQQPDLVILDEPTNHLDLDAIEWLEDFLSTSNMAIIMVTHDRYFLENVTNEIMELDGGNLYHYQGNYSYYLEKKDERRTLEETEVEKSRNLMRKELDWIRRQPKARGTKAKYRIDAFEDLKKKASKDLSEKSLEVDVVQRRQGGKILELESVSKSYGDKHILQPFSYIFRKREKVGIVGPNGAGKTTFLNIITGRLEPDQGKVDKGPTTVMGYYQQKEPEFDDTLKVIDVIREVTDVVTLSDGSKVSASQMLNRFNFPPKKQHDKVGKLSGGEKRRLQLMLVLLKNPNFLILDEPTNDLDLNTLRVLEDFLSSFEGCLLLVSHDRYFMDRLVDHLFIFEAGKEVTDYNGSYSAYREEVREEEAREVKRRTEKPKAETSAPAAKLSYNEKREMENLENEMEKINTKITELTRQLQSGDLDHEALAQAGAEIGTLRDLLDAKEMRWLELSEKDA